MLNIINKIEDITGFKPIPIQTKSTDDCVVYKYWQTETFKYRMELRCIAGTLSDAEHTAAAIIQGLCNVGDVNKLQSYPSIVLNGGGVMIDNNTNTVHRLLYLDIVKRK